MPQWDEREWQLVEKFSIEFARAESLLKDAEGPMNGLVIPAINELRYAGEHARRALYDHPDDEAARLDNWNSAVKHCRRAAYDVCDALLTSYVATIDKFFDDFAEYDVGIEVDRVESAHREADLARGMVRRVLEDHARGSDQRDGLVEQIESLKSTLGQATSDLRRLRPLYAKRVRKQRRNDRLTLIAVIFGSVIAGIAGAAAAVAAFAALMSRT